jgi:hypothetical protein
MKRVVPTEREPLQPGDVVGYEGSEWEVVGRRVVGGGPGEVPAHARLTIRREVRHFERRPTGPPRERKRIEQKDVDEARTRLVARQDSLFGEEIDGDQPSGSSTYGTYGA